MYQVKVQNKTQARVSRGQHAYPPGISTYNINDEELFLINHCKYLKLLELKYVCNLCQKVFDNKKGLTMHLNVTHKENEKDKEDKEDKEE